MHDSKTNAPMNTGASTYSTAEIAKKLGISLQTVQRWVDSGRLKAWRTPGGHRRVDAKSAELLFQSYEHALGHRPTAELPDGAQTTAMRVVIVDDDPIYRELMSTLVQAAFPLAQSLVAGNGFQGLMMIAKFAPDIVITDIRMPHMDGFEMIRTILADGSPRPRLLIAVSAKSQEELLELGKLSPDVTFLQKPFEREAFFAALQCEDQGLARVRDGRQREEQK
jgi:excisionase family DNA binding protein